MIKIRKEFRRFSWKWVILTVHNFARKGASLTVFLTQAESLRLWWVHGGRLFYACGPACAKARSPNDVVVLGMMRSPTAADRKRTIALTYSHWRIRMRHGENTYTHRKDTHGEEYVWGEYVCGRIHTSENTHGEEYVWGEYYVYMWKNTYEREYVWGRIRMGKNTYAGEHYFVRLTSHIPFAVVGFSDVTLKLLVDDHYCGRIIGREGKGIKKIRDDTGARISISKLVHI